MPCVETMRKEQDKNQNPVPLIAGAMLAGGAKKAGQTAYAVTEEVAPEVFEAGADMVYGITDKLKGLFKKNPAVGEKVSVDFGNGYVEVTIIRPGKVAGFWVVNANGQEITVPENAIFETTKKVDDMKRYDDYQVPELEQNPPCAKDINNNETIIVPTMEQQREWAFTLANGQTRKAKYPLGFIPDDENCPKMNPDEGQVEITLITPTDGKCWNCADAGCDVCKPPVENPPVAPAPIPNPQPPIKVSPEGEKAVLSENPKANPPKWNKRKITTEFVGLLVSAKDVEKAKKYKSKFINFWSSADEASKKYVRERLVKRPNAIQELAKSWMSIKANPGENMITELNIAGTGVETQLENVSEVVIVNPPEEVTPVVETPVTTPEAKPEVIATEPIPEVKVETPTPAPEAPVETKIENPPLPPQPVKMSCEHELKFVGKGNPKVGGKTVDVYNCQKCKKNFIWRG